jgi:pimeloyl-ACP methyl ester carboxylesterase
MSDSNPYLSRNALRDDRVFVGRRYEKKAILSRVYAAQPQSVEIIGARRVGKSSLLHAIHRTLAADGRADVVHVFLDGQVFVGADPTKFFAEVLGQVERQHPVSNPAPATYQGFTSTIEALEQGGARLILLIDEFDLITKNAHFPLEFFNFLRAQANNHQVAYVLSTVRELELLCHSEDISGSPFFNIFFRLHLGPLLLEDAHELIEKPSSQAGVDLLLLEDWIIDISGLFPLCLQITCAHAFEAQLNAPMGELDRHCIEQEAARELRPHFEHMLRTIDGRAREVLTTIATGGPVPAVDQPSIELLQSRGHISRTAVGLCFASCLFKNFFLQKLGFVSLNSLVVTIRCDSNSASVDEELISVCAKNEGSILSKGSTVIAGFRSFELGIGSCIALRDSLVGKDLRVKIVAIAHNDADEFAKTRELSDLMAERTDYGEITTTARVITGLPKPLARKFRKVSANRRNAEGPRMFRLTSRLPSRPKPVFLGRPAAGTNNVWYEHSASDTAFVFIHGIFSDSSSCWLDAEGDIFWPDLVLTDPRLERPSIFLGGYFTQFNSDCYDLDNCEHELFSALNRPPINRALSPVLQRKKIVFICHSTGGIVARYMLERRFEQFAGKQVGLVLVASPSYGSKLADKLGWLAKIYKNRLGQQLQWGAWSLQDLDSRFKELLHEQKIPGLVGVEAYENKFIIRRRFLPNITHVVNEESAGRYFGPPVLLRDTDHFSSAKPNSPSHPSHETLVDFYLKEFRQIKTISFVQRDRVA